MIISHLHRINILLMKSLIPQILYMIHHKNIFSRKIENDTYIKIAHKNSYCMKLLFQPTIFLL